MGHARMTITYELLVELLHLPEGTQIEAHFPPLVEGIPHVVDFVVSHPDLPEYTPGSYYLRVFPVLRTVYEEPRQHIEFVDWGLPK